MQPIVFISGGVKSGKSNLAYQCLESLTEAPTLIATARRTDTEMSARIDRHIQDRAGHWSTVEAPIELPDALIDNTQRPIVVDCLGVWITNILIEHPDKLDEFKESLLASLNHRQAPTVFVSNECGLGVIGSDSLTRKFVDEVGLLNQKIAEQATHVAFTVSGLPMWLKGKPLI